MITRHTKRILVVGPPGAGKSAFSKLLAEKMMRPLYHLDDYYWLQGWKRVDHEAWCKILEDLCQKPNWIMDGNHLKTFSQRVEHADAIIMLDYAPALCFLRFLKRSIKRYFNFDRQLPKNIVRDLDYRPKITIQWHLLKLILFYRITTRPLFIAIAENKGCALTILRSDKEAFKFLENSIT